MKTLHLSIIIVALIFAMLSSNSTFAQTPTNDSITAPSNRTDTTIQQKSMTQDELYSIFENNLPGFGGMFRDESGKLNVYVTDPEKAKSIGTKIFYDYLEPYQTSAGIVFLKGKEPWHVWSEWQQDADTLANNRSLGITETGVDQKNQMLLIGFESLNTTNTYAVETFLKSHQIPLDVVELIVTGKIQILPEFQFVIPILLISISLMIVFYRMKFRK